MQFGDKIRALRQEKKLTQPELAERLNVEQSWLSKIENNKVMPSREFIQSVLNFFEVRLEDLLEDFEPEYVKSHLAAIPEVAGHLSLNRSKRRSQRKKWIIGSAIASIIGSVILAVTVLNVFFPDNKFQYVSLGVLYFGEPDELYERPEQIFHELGIEFRGLDYLSLTVDDAVNEQSIASPFEKADLKNEYVRNKRAIFKSYVLARREQSSFVSNIDRGESIIRQQDTLSPIASNIFGEEGKEPRRVYSRHDTEIPNLYQGLCYLFGFLSFFSGLFGFVVEYRLSMFNI